MRVIEVRPKSVTIVHGRFNDIARAVKHKDYVENNYLPKSSKVLIEKEK